MKSFTCRIHTLVLLVVFTLSARAQTPVAVKVNGLQAPTVTMIVEYFADDNWKNLQTIKDPQAGTYAGKITFPHDGQYRFRFSSDPKKWCEFLIVRKDIPANGIELTLEYQQLKGSMVKLYESAEQDAYMDIMTKFNEVSLNKDSLDRFGLQYQLREQAFAKTCSDIATAYPSTFAANLLAKVSPVALYSGNPEFAQNADSLVRFAAMHVMDNMPINHPDVLHHIAFIRRINIAYQYFEKTKQPEIYIDLMMKKVLVSESMTTYMFKFLLDKMITYRNELGLSYLITWYADDCTEEGHMEENTRNLLTALDNCKPGKTIEFLTLPDASGKMISSKKVFAENKVTILLFWRANCSHCKEFEPKLEEFYAQYHSKGLGVYAIGTDKTQEEWLAQDKLNESPWPSVFLANDQRKDFNKRFPVPSTPTLLAVDQNGVVLKRLITRSKIETEIKELLGL
jgi:thiol-disulfide isomerase/thioredoxin